MSFTGATNRPILRIKLKLTTHLGGWQHHPSIQCTPNTQGMRSWGDEIAYWYFPVGEETQPFPSFWKSVVDHNKKDKCAAYRPNTIVSYLPPYQPSSPCPWEALYKWNDLRIPSGSWAAGDLVPMFGRNRDQKLHPPSHRMPCAEATGRKQSATILLVAT